MKCLPAVVVALAVLLLFPLSAPGQALEELVPDLVIIKPSQAEIRLVEENGRRLLRYSGTVRNSGEGALELEGVRQSVDEAPTVYQRVYQRDGSSSLRSTSVEMFWSMGLSGHEHWHVRDFMLGELFTADGGFVGRLSKIGFCFFDSEGPSRRALPTYTAWGCENRNSLSIEMGLSPRWVDEYGWHLPGQYVDVTGLPAGRYTLRISVNQDLGFLDADHSNEAVEVTVRL